MTKNSTTRITISGLVVGTVGIAILWAAGQQFPFYPPPGIVILLAGALVIGFAKLRWAPAIGAALGLFVSLGTLISPDGLSNLGASRETAQPAASDRRQGRRSIGPRAGSS